MAGEDYAATVRLAAKAAAKEEAQLVAKPIAERIDTHGKLEVWHLREMRFKKMWPVDAMGLLQTDQATLEKPKPEPEPEPEPSPPQSRRKRNG